MSPAQSSLRTRPILISFSYVFLSVFLNFTFTIFPTAYFSVELANSSVFAQRDWLQIISGTVLPVEGKSPVSIVRLGYPSLPPLRDFQVASSPTHHIPHNYNMVGQFQADILASAADDEDAFHILSCLPTGYGKSLPMLLLSLFLPQGTTIEYTAQLKCSIERAQ